MLVCLMSNCVSIQDEDPRVAETAVVGYGHEDYGEGILAILPQSLAIRPLQLDFIDKNLKNKIWCDLKTASACL